MLKNLLCIKFMGQGGVGNEGTKGEIHCVLLNFSTNIQRMKKYSHFQFHQPA